MPGDFDPILLDRFLTGECTAEEVERVRAWLAVDSVNVAQMDELREVREVVGSTPTWDAKAVWRDLSVECDISTAGRGDACVALNGIASDVQKYDGLSNRHPSHWLDRAQFTVSWATHASPLPRLVGI